MIIDRIETRGDGDAVTRSARIRYGGGQEFDLRISGPLAAQDEPRDGSPFLATVLQLAMRFAEPVHVDGPVSARLLRTLETPMAAFANWDPRLAPVAVTAAEEASAERAPGVGCFFSRGIDSLVSAASERFEPGPATALVYVNGLEPRHDARVRAAEQQRCDAAAAALGLPLIHMSTNLRELLDPVLPWHDSHGAAMAGLALALRGRVGAVVVAPSEPLVHFGPFGAGLNIEPRFSSEAVAVHYDSMALTRVGKAACLAAQRPDLLPHMKVCFKENRPDNCGRCQKCLWTMVSLLAVGALDKATQFPPRIDLEAVRRLRLTTIRHRFEWEEALVALARDGEQGEVRAAVADMLRRSARPPLREWLPIVRDRARGRRPVALPAWVDPASGFEQRHTARALELSLYGRSEAGDAVRAPIVTTRLRPATADPG